MTCSVFAPFGYSSDESTSDATEPQMLKYKGDIPQQLMTDDKSHY